MSDAGAGGRPSFGAVVLTQGTRPDGLATALRSLLAQRDVDLDVVVVQDGVPPERAGDVVEPRLPEGVKHVRMSRNVGIPAGRNAGVDEVRGDLLLFLDDDVELTSPTYLRDAADLLRRRPRVGLVQPRPVDPETGRTARRWVPRMLGRRPTAPGPVFSLWEGATVVRREVLEAVGRWPEAYFYGHEGVELAWRVWDTGHQVWYAADLVVAHPDVAPAERHAQYYERVARNRVWLARRNLGPVWGAVYRRVWGLIEDRRAPDDAARAALRRGREEGLRTDGAPWPARRLRRRTPWVMLRHGRPPVV